MEHNLNKLWEDFPEEAVQRASSIETKKGYDTTGYGYQFIVDRFNSVFGYDWGYQYTILREATGEYSSGKKFFDITVEVGIWVFDKEKIRFHAGGHTGLIYADALKGAISNAFKKCAAMWGCGAKAFRGEIDDDIILPESPQNIKHDTVNKINNNFTKQPGDIEKAIDLILLADSKEKLDEIELLLNKRSWNENDKKKLLQMINERREKCLK